MARTKAAAKFTAHEVHTSQRRDGLSQPNRDCESPGTRSLHIGGTKETDAPVSIAQSPFANEMLWTHTGALNWQKKSRVHDSAYEDLNKRRLNALEYELGKKENQLY